MRLLHKRGVGSRNLPIARSALRPVVVLPLDHPNGPEKFCVLRTMRSANAAGCRAPFFGLGASFEAKP